MKKHIKKMTDRQTDRQTDRKLFITFLLIHLVVWSSIGLIRTVLPTDSLEGIFWGSLHDFGTPKHPPLAGWLTYLAFLPFKSDFCVYLLSQLFIVGGFIFIYKLAKYFLDETASMLSVIVLEGCWVYSYITGYYGFNPDVVLLLILPMIAYYFYKCVHFEKPLDWLILGVTVGFAFLNKYQTALVILPMFIWTFLFRKQVFKNKFFYISMIIAFLIFLPHICWLIKYEFLPFMYFEGELKDTGWLNHITAPLLFLLMQIVVTIGSLLIFAITKIKFNSPFKLRENIKAEDAWFLILLGFVPFLVHFVMGIFEGGTMRPRWGFEFWFLLGITLFYFFPFKEITKQEFKFILKSAYVVMSIIFLSLGTLLSVEKNYRSRYPVATIYSDMQKAWSKKCDTPIKYVGGYIEWSLPITIYTDSHPATILDTFGYKNPWLDENDMKANGVLVIDRTKDKVINQTFKSCPYLPKDFVVEPVPYSFELTNAFGQPRTYNIYYYIVTPQK